MKDLDLLRKEIDSIDKEISSLLSKRLCVVEKIAEYKKANSITIENACRETQVLQNVLENVDKNKQPYVKEIYNTIFTQSKKHQAIILKEKESKWNIVW